jgi:hypothetical protein
MKVIKLSEAQKLDLELAWAMGNPDGLDANTAAYVSYTLLRGPIQEGKILARICKESSCVNPAHLILVEP